MPRMQQMMSKTSVSRQCPQVAKKQQLKDGMLVSWSAEHIYHNWLDLLFPHVTKYMNDVHQPLEDGEYHFIPLLAYRGRLNKFVKKDPVTGSDLELIKTGKGKKVEDKTLYFGLHFNVPPRIWLKNNWASSLSDTEYKDKSKKGKNKAQPKPVSTRQSTSKAASKDHGTKVIELDSDDGAGPSFASTRMSQKGQDKGVQRETPVKVKLEPEIASNSKSDKLFTQQAYVAL
ncbi:hypothetical protein MSAN_01122500 [Mycena sanguinolenta]|uniref:Uncharacterized protein n=1 Tax=Mycena sanguinolenta TaxID=230812 RepID=A0A8H7D496_9AGAR|nr:hypothetical protein MSAN_01122500 [Mycena sanguinolenta]